VDGWVVHGCGRGAEGVFCGVDAKKNFLFTFVTISTSTTTTITMFCEYLNK
jgi:hypothetical protein